MDLNAEEIDIKYTLQLYLFYIRRHIGYVPEV